MATTAPPRAPRGTTNGKAAEPRLGIDPTSVEFLLVNVDAIRLGDNVRADLGDLDELRASIEAVGILQPVGLRRLDEGYLLVFGHRRLAAAKLAGLVGIPALIVDAEQTPAERTTAQLIENVQRRDLNALEEARALRAILDASTGMTQEQLADRVGRSRPAVTNLLRILDTTAPVQRAIAEGKLSAAHAKALAGLPKSEQERWASRAIDYGYSSHNLENYIANEKTRREQDSQQSATERKLAAERLAKVIGQLPDKDARIVVSRYYSGQAVAGRLRKLGYKNVTQADFRNRKDGLDCDCDVTGIEVGYSGGGLKVYPACVSQPHRDAKYKVERAAEETSRAAQQRLRDAVAAQVGEASRRLPGDVARVLLWIAFDWSLNDWVREHKGDRKKANAWAELQELDEAGLAAELKKYVAKGLGDRYNVKLDWPAIAEAFGVPLEAPAEKPKRRRKAAMS